MAESRYQISFLWSQSQRNEAGVDGRGVRLRSGGSGLLRGHACARAAAAQARVLLPASGPGKFSRFLRIFLVDNITDNVYIHTARTFSRNFFGQNLAKVHLDKVHLKFANVFWKRQQSMIGKYL